MLEKSNEINTDKNSLYNLTNRKIDIFPNTKYTLNNYDFKKELLFFKNEILKDMHNIEAKQTEKLINYTEEQNKIMNSYEKKFLEQNRKISYLSNLIQEFFNKDKFEKYFIEFNTKFEHTLAEMKSKIYLLQNDIKDVLNKSERNLREHIFYPGKIGYKCQFKDFHAFIDYVLDSIHQLGAYQEILKSYELHKIKKNLENELKTVEVQIKNNFNILSKFTLDKINESEQKMINVLQDYNTQFVDVRIENNQNANNLQKKINEVSHNFEQIIKIRKDINLKNEEQDKKFQNIFQNLEENENKLIEQRKELNNIDAKFNILTTYIDNQNAENYKDDFNINSRKISNNKINGAKRIQSAKDFIDRQLRLIAKGIIINKDNSNTNYNNKTLSATKEYNNEVSKNHDQSEDKNIKTNNIKSQQQHKKNFLMNKKLIFKGDSFIKRYITGKISIGDMYNHPNNVLYKNPNNKIPYESSPPRINKNSSQKNDKSNIFNLTKIQSNLSSTKNNNIKTINIENSNYSKNKIITKSLSDGNYNSRNSNLISHENFLRNINSMINRKNKFKQFLSPLNTYQKTSYNRFIEQQLIREKKYGKKRNKLLIIQ